MNPFKSKKGLGRGLSSLIGDIKNTPTNNKLSISDDNPLPKPFFDLNGFIMQHSHICYLGLKIPL